MNVITKKRVGLFVYDWGMYHYIKDFAIKLAEYGYCIDIFFKDWDIRPKLVDTNEFQQFKNINFFNFTISLTMWQMIKRRSTKLLNIIAIFFKIPRNGNPEKLINQEILNKSRKIVELGNYYCFIGIEKQGLIWAGLLSEIYNIPFIYFSLELFIEDYPGLFRFYHLLNAERKYHKLAAATIIQDESRAKVLQKSNRLNQMKVLLYPVSSKGIIVREKSKFLQSKLHIDENTKIVLYFGTIDKTRFVTQIVKMANYFDDGVVLVVHGFGRKSYLNYLQSIANKEKVKFSLDFISEEDIENLISSTDIGISLYKTTNANDRLVAFSSSKIAYYTQCGVPMIAFETESFKELENNFQCLELIQTIEEMPIKVRRILNNYDLYREASFAAYQRFYQLDENFSRFINDFEKIIDSLDYCN